MNLGYNRSRNKEQDIKLALQKEGYFAIRSAGSKGAVDVVGLKPADCGDASHYEVKFIQIKVSENLKNESRTVEVLETEHFPINLELWKFPIKSKKWYEQRRSAKTTKR